MEYVNMANASAILALSVVIVKKKKSVLIIATIEANVIWENAFVIMVSPAQNVNLK